jgi:hypothetical protein
MYVAHSNSYHYIDCGLSIDEWMATIEASVRKAVIREASVGTLTKTQPYLPDIYYDIVPKETT